jgi:hypothetical protein
MMKALEEDFKKLPAIARGEVTVEIPPSIITAPPREAKKTGKPKQEKLF